jgi:hypothetical protein
MWHQKQRRTRIRPIVPPETNRRDGRHSCPNTQSPNGGSYCGPVCLFDLEGWMLVDVENPHDGGYEQEGQKGHGCGVTVTLPGRGV